MAQIRQYMLFFTWLLCILGFVRFLILIDPEHNDIIVETGG
jgi:hypothetical protein